MDREEWYDLASWSRRVNGRPYVSILDRERHLWYAAKRFKSRFAYGATRSPR